jgi:hypothetical protein
MTTVTPSQPVAPAQPEQLADSPVQPSANSGGADPLPNNPNADITITCTKGSESKQVTGKSPVQCPTGYQMKPMQPGQPGQMMDPNADITITCTKGSESKQVTGKSPVQCPTGYQMKPMQPGQPNQPGQPASP